MRPNKFGHAMIIARLRLGVKSNREILSSEIAKKLGVTPGYVSSIEHGRKKPNIRLLAKILKVYSDDAKALRTALKLEL